MKKLLYFFVFLLAFGVQAYAQPQAQQLRTLSSVQVKKMAEQSAKVGIQQSALAPMNTQTAQMEVQQPSLYPTNTQTAQITVPSKSVEYKDIRTQLDPNPIVKINRVTGNLRATPSEPTHKNYDAEIDRLSNILNDLYKENPQNEAKIKKIAAHLERTKAQKAKYAPTSK